MPLWARQWPTSSSERALARTMMMACRGSAPSPPRCLVQVGPPCSFLLRILTHKRFHSNLAIAPTCDTVSTFHITDNARDPQRGLSRATYLLKVSRRPAEPARRSLDKFCAVHGALRGWFASMPLPCVDDGPRMMALQHFMKTFHLPPRLLRSCGQRSHSRD